MCAPETFELFGMLGEALPIACSDNTIAFPDAASGRLDQHHLARKRPAVSKAGLHWGSPAKHRLSRIG